MTDETNDGLGALAHENAETKKVALFPETAKSEHEWEQRAIEMHGNQQTIQLEAKPIENVLRARIARAD